MFLKVAFIVNNISQCKPNPNFFNSLKIDPKQNAFNRSRSYNNPDNKYPDMPFCPFYILLLCHYVALSGLEQSLKV